VATGSIHGLSAASEVIKSCNESRSAIGLSYALPGRIFRNGSLVDTMPSLPNLDDDRVVDR